MTHRMATFDSYDDMVVNDCPMNHLITLGILQADVILLPFFYFCCKKILSFFLSSFSCFFYFYIYFLYLSQSYLYKLVVFEQFLVLFYPFQDKCPLIGITKKECAYADMSTQTNLSVCHPSCPFRQTSLCRNLPCCPLGLLHLDQWWFRITPRRMKMSTLL